MQEWKVWQYLSRDQKWRYESKGHSILILMWSDKILFEEILWKTSQACCKTYKNKIHIIDIDQTNERHNVNQSICTKIYLKYKGTGILKVKCCKYIYHVNIIWNKSGGGGTLGMAVTDFLWTISIVKKTLQWWKLSKTII